MVSLLVLVSGAAGLALEVLWMRDFALWFGSTAAGVAVVLSVYFAGLALGAHASGRLGAGRHPLRVYGLLEAGTAFAVVVYVLLLRPRIPLAAAWIANATPSWGLPFGRLALVSAVLLVPTVLLGATVPVVAAQMRDAAGAGRLYAWNTLGGAAGALATGFVVLPLTGMRRTFFLVAGVELVIASIALLYAGRAPASSAPVPEDPASTPRPRLAGAVAAVAGGVALAAEVLWTRGLSGVLGSSIYSMSLVLGAVLCGVVAGTAAAVGLLRHGGRRETQLAGVAAVAAITVVASTGALRVLPAASLALVQSLGGTGLATGLVVEAILATLVVFLPAAAIGTVLPLSLGLGDSRRPERALAVPLAANTAGGVAGALAGAFVLLPVFGIGGGLLLLAAVLVTLATALASRPHVRWSAGIAAAALAAGAVLAPPLPFPWRPAAGERILLRHDGPTATVLVTEDPGGARRLRINGQYSLGGGHGVLLERRQALLPLLLHREPRRLLHLGVGTGNTLGAAMASPGLTADGVELVSDALDAIPLFARTNGDLARDARVRLVADDARSVLLASREQWDVILVDLLLPWTSGAGALFSREFYQLGLAHLAPGGLFAQWLPLHQLDASDLAAIVATFTGVFPHVQLWVAYHRARTPLALLVGSAAPLAADAAVIRDRLRDPGLHAVASGVGLEDADDLAVLYVTDGAHLRAATLDVPPITDDDPRIEFSAPRGYFHQERLAPASLAWIAARLDPDPAPIVGARPASFRLRADLLVAQLALLAGDGPAELQAYLDALAAAPTPRRASGARRHRPRAQPGRRPGDHPCRPAGARHAATSRRLIRPDAA